MHKNFANFRAVLNATALFALAFTIPGTLSAQSDQAYTVGQPWTGAAGIQKRTGDLTEASRNLNPPSYTHQKLRKRADAIDHKAENPDSPKVPGYPYTNSPAFDTNVVESPQTFSSSFTGATLSDTHAFPPDSMGAIGPNQFIVACNGRVRTFNKITGLADGVMDVDTDVFFNSVMTPPASNNFTSDPRIRYDRFSHRWYIIMLDVPGQAGTLPNRMMLAVSDGETITPASVWTFFQFQQDLVSPAGDTGEFADYPTLGVDVNALYVGVNIFATSGSGAFANTTLFVVRKSSILGAGPIVVTAFRGLITKVHRSSVGPYTPQGVDNFDPAAAEGFAIGVDVGIYGELHLRRIANPGGTPAISGNITLTVPSTAAPLTVPHSGNTGGANGNLDGLDDRLMSAHIRNGHLWTSQNVGVDNTGVASTGTATRDGVRWYELQGIATGGTLSIVQSGTIFQPSAGNTTGQRFYWMGTVMTSGEGHMAAGFSSAGASEFINAASVGRLAKDPLGTTQTPALYTASSTSYNPPGDTGGSGGRRWGDYSYTSVDPADDMTMWTIQEFCQATDSYGVRVVKLLAPLPATPVTCNPPFLVIGTNNVNVTVIGNLTNGAGYFDPPAGFSNHIAAAVNGGGVTVNSIAFSNPSNIVLNVSVSPAASPGARTISVTNPDGQSATSLTGILTITGAATNHPPVLTSISNQTVNEGSALAFTASASDTDGNALTYSLDPGAPTNAIINATNGNFSWTPTEAQGPSSNAITVRVTDNGSPALSDFKTFSVFVNEVNAAPALAAIGNQTINELTTLSFTASGTDTDLPANILTYSLDAGAPTNATINPASGFFSWTPSEAQGPSSNSITVRVTDNGSPQLSAPRTFFVIVNEVNSAPVLTSIPNQSINELSLFAFTASATDSDLPANNLTFSLDPGAPTNATINPTTGDFAWTPTEAQGPSSNSITVRVTDNGTPPLSDTRTFSVIVNEVNFPPLLTSIPNQNVNELSLLALTASATDSDFPANNLTYSLDPGAPTNATINPTNGNFSWTPTEAQGPSSNSITVRVTDDGSPPLSDTRTFAVFVSEVNSAPLLQAIPDQTVNELSLLSLTASASDADFPANNLTYSLDPGAPTNATINPTNGNFAWTPTEAQGPSSNSITVRVTDDGSPPLSDTRTFSVIVNEVNSAPLLAAIPDQTVNELSLLAFTASATDSDLPANNLTYSLDPGAPTNATINPTNGNFSWTPSEDQGPATNSITVRVTDDGAPPLSDTKTFSVIVNEVNSAPVLAAIFDHSIHVGSTLVITNSASDSDIPTNTLVFSLALGAPASANINPTNGVFSWTPTDTDIGTNSFTVRVTDNGAPPLNDEKTFAVIVVTPPVFQNISISNSTVTLTWSTLTGQTYRVQFKTNLEDPAWTDLPGDVTASGATASKTDSINANTQRFYRVVVVP